MHTSETISRGRTRGGANPPCFSSRGIRNAAARGFTLVEVLVSLGVGSLVLAVIATVFTTSARSFAVMGNYISIDSNSRMALDQMTREIRRAGQVTVLTNTPTSARLELLKQGTTNSFLVYQWDNASRQLSQWATGTQTNVLLTECDSLAFSMCKSTFVTATNVADAKSIGVTWSCSRTILGRITTSEPMQQALIVIRN